MSEVVCVSRIGWNPRAIGAWDDSRSHFWLFAMGSGLLLKSIVSVLFSYPLGVRSSMKHRNAIR